MRAALLSIALFSSTAFAENDLNPPGREIDRDPDSYVSVGAITGSDHFTYGGVLAEVGRRIGQLRETPLFVRGMVHGGTTHVADNPGRGTYVEARGGVEGRQCMYGGIVCAAVGVDVGLHRGRFEYAQFDDNGRLISKPEVAPPAPAGAFEQLDSLVVAPRVTLDAGNRVRFRAVAERPYHFTKDGTVGGIAGTLSLAIGF